MEKGKGRNGRWRKMRKMWVAVSKGRKERKGSEEDVERKEALGRKGRRKEEWRKGRSKEG